MTRDKVIGVTREARWMLRPIEILVDESLARQIFTRLKIWPTAMPMHLLVSAAGEESGYLDA